MAGTIVTMNRTTLVVSGTNKYQIMATCGVKGTLPDTAIFLMRIQTRTDPRDDTLIRVVAIADTVVANTDRDLVIAAGGTEWRSTSVLLQYDDIETANAAWKELSARINALVSAMDTYLTEFTTTVRNETIVYPTTDTTTVTALTNAYLSSRSAVTTAESARDTEQAECTSLQAEINAVTARLNDAVSDLDRAGQVQGQVSVYTTAYSSVRGSLAASVTTLRGLNAISSATVPEKTDIEAQLVAEDAQLAAFAGTNAALNGTLSGLISSTTSILQTRVSTLTSERANLLTQYNNCTAATARLQAAVDAARATRDAALADVRAVCPDYVPPSS